MRNIKLKYEQQAKEAARAYEGKAAQIQSQYKEDVAKGEVAKMSSQLRAQALQMERDYVAEIDSFIVKEKRKYEAELREEAEKKKQGQEDLEKVREKNILNSAILDQLQHNADIMTINYVMSSNNEDAQADLIERFKNNRQMLELIKVKAPKKNYEGISKHIAEIEAQYTENKLKELEHEARVMRSNASTVTYVIKHKTDMINNPYF